ncbi:protein spaetzle [Trichonephila inaurata madagascariensis]|uniref:Protein spaetzle n=1 Tax=Trichonephila inaurata madagascariensis TaxID=2747483 RepID=A0A8X6YWW0_9ARAC|nr:protein spaetzle [Trichonephila inaurata madagascariensis]
MEHRTVASCVWVSCVILIQIHVTSQQTLRHRTSSRNLSKRAVLFPETNTSGHSLPVFPDPVVEYVGRELPLAPPTDKFGRPFCINKAEDTFCEKVEDYPKAEIRKAINYSSEEFLELFGTMAISSRKSFDLNEDTVCEQHSRIFFPQAAENENDQWAYVVNDVDYVQTVMAEICVHVNQECRYLEGNLPAGVTSRCRQKYAYKRLLALHPSKKKTYTDSFRFPSCCSCYVKKSFLTTRIRAIEVEDKTPAKQPVARSRRNQGRL